MARHRIRTISATGLGLASLTYTIAIASLTGCERDPNHTRAKQLITRGVQIEFIGPGDKNSSWPGIVGGARRYAAAVPTVRVEATTVPAEPLAEVHKVLAEALRNKPEAVCLYISPADVANPIALQAKLSQIHNSAALIVTIGYPYPDERVFGHVSVNLPGTAEFLGNHLKQIARQHRSYILCHEQGANETATTCYRRFISAASRQPDLNLLLEQNTFNPPRDTAAVLDETFALFPHVGLVVTLNPTVWLESGADLIKRLRQRNKDFRFVTLSAAPQLWHRLGTPSQPGPAAALVGPIDGDLGYAATEMAVQVLMSQNKPPKLHWIDAEIVTAETLPDFARRYRAAANGLDVSEFLPAGLPTTTPSDPE